MALNYLEFSEVVSWPVGFKQMYLPAQQEVIIEQPVERVVVQEPVVRQVISP